MGGVIPEKSSHCSPSQTTPTWQFQSGGLLLKSPPIAAHCSPLLHGNFSQGGNSWKVLPLQPIAAHSYMAISVRGVNSWKVLPLQPIAAQLLHQFTPSEQINPTLLHQFTPHRQIIPPLFHQNGRILGRTFDPGKARYDSCWVILNETFAAAAEPSVVATPGPSTIAVH